MRDRLVPYLPALKSYFISAEQQDKSSPRRTPGQPKDDCERQHGDTASTHAQAAAAAARDWLRDLVETTHGLIVGHTRAGKTVLTHYAASQRAGQGQHVIVCDPDARPGMWPGCVVVGGGDQYAAIEQQLQAVWETVRRRREQRGQGMRRFPPVTLILSEASDIIAACPTARPILETILRRGAKLGLSLLVDVQDAQVRTLDLPGASHVLHNFSLRLTVRKVDGQRWVRIDGADYPVPVLPDPEQLADTYHPSTTNARPEQHHRTHDLALAADPQEGAPVPGEKTCSDTSCAPRQERLVDVPESRAKAIRELLALGASRNQVAAVMGIGRAKALTQIEAAITASAQRQELVGEAAFTTTPDDPQTGSPR